MNFIIPGGWYPGSWRSDTSFKDSFKPWLSNEAGCTRAEFVVCPLIVIVTSAEKSGCSVRAKEATCYCALENKIVDLLGYIFYFLPK